MDEQTHVNPYDECMQTKELQMLKTLLPYLPVARQRQMAFVIQYLQLKNTLTFIENPPASLVAAESEARSPADNRTQMLNALKQCCSPKEQEMIDTILNILCVMDNCETMLN